MKPHPYKLKPYHNPEGVDESKVPNGWRFRYADEMNVQPYICAVKLMGEWCPSFSYKGTDDMITYIVPVTL